MKLTFLPIVDWGMGTILIGVFALVCVVIALVVYNLAKGGKKEDESID